MNSFFRKLIDKTFNSTPHELFNCFGKTDPGRVRKHNEDSYSIEPHLSLFLVADGMGGHKAGEVASRLATESLLKYFTSATCRKISGNQEEIRHSLISAFHHANDTVSNMSLNNEEFKGMGCTLVACFIDNNTLHTCHVGDSRCYVADERGIKKITRDHTFTNEAPSESNLQNKDNAGSMQRNMLTMAVGFPFPEDPEYNSLPLETGNKIVLCSDGLWNMVEDQIIYQVLRESVTPDIACNKLIRMANKAGGTDNITAVVIYC